jgi:hypothetical protein
MSNDEARKAWEAWERMDDAARAVDAAAGDPFGLRVRLAEQFDEAADDLDDDDDEEAS